MSESTRSQRFISQYFDMIRNFCYEEYGRCNVLVKGSGVSSKEMKAAVVQDAIVLNIGHDAVKNYGFGDTHFWFEGRVDGAVFHETIAFSAVLGIQMNLMDENEGEHWFLLNPAMVGSFESRNPLVLGAVLLQEPMGIKGSSEAPTTPPVKRWTPQLITGGRQQTQVDEAAHKHFVTGLSVVNPVVEPTTE